MGELNFDNLLGEQEIDTLFTEPEETEINTKDDEVHGDDTSETNPGEHDETKVEETTEVNPEDLFNGEDEPESVGSGKQDEGSKGDTTTDEDGGTSPKNFYSSIASALAVDGIFPNLDDEAIKKATDAESFSDLIEAEINARLDEKQQRISKALDNGVEPDDIRKYENTLNYLSSITEANISEESEKGEQLRRNLIYQDFLNRGMSPEKAQKLTARSIDAGNDVEDAKEAFQSNREFFQNAYNQLLQDAQKRADADREERDKQASKLKESILKDKNLMGDIEISSDLRKKVFDNISKPVYKDPETGEYLTALQKYEMEHRADFLKYVGLFMTLTNGFKDFDSFTKGKVKKELKKGLRELEQTLSNSHRGPSGGLKMVTNAQNDPESYFGKGFKLDI